MNIIRKIFSKKTSEGVEPCPPEQPPDVDPGKDPNLIRGFDKYGREMFITRQDWRDNVLMGSLDEVQKDPQQLYEVLVGALQDGFAADIVPYAEQLWHIDPIPSRGATILGIVFMEVDRLDDAQRVLEDFIARHGEDGIVLNNLAKVHHRRGDTTRAEAILWHALELDPNQDNGLGWYVEMQRDRGGEAAALDAFRRIAALPQSWRARIWLAQDALQRNDLAAAVAFYEEALAMVANPAPTDLLMQMSGDLGKDGHMAELIRLTKPHFDPAIHGVMVGNNLIKANFDLGQLEEARRVLDLLYAQKRPDWRETLSYWDAELAKANVTAQARTMQPPQSISILSIEGPLWMRDRSPFATLLPTKHTGAPRVAVFGSTALSARSTEQPGSQLSDNPGRMSRAIPLALAEQIHLGTTAVGVALIAWARDHGFALLGRPHDDSALCSLAGKGSKAPELVVSVTLNTTHPVWKVALHVLRQADARRLAETSVEASAENPGPAIDGLSESLLSLLETHAGINLMPIPSWYQRPSGFDASDYLLRLEQQLAIACMNLDFLKGGGLFGEREMLDGILQLCVRQPANPTVRMVLAQTLRQMKKVRPDILPEYKDKIAVLQQDHPLSGVSVSLIRRVIAGVFPE
jgi:tetratricopeptide (TPR) repeat protein